MNECFKGSKANPAYGLTWWLNPKIDNKTRSNESQSTDKKDTGRKNTGIPDDLIFAAGAGKQRLYISRSLKLVVVRQALGIGKSPKRQKGNFVDAEFLCWLLLGRPLKKKSTKAKDDDAFVKQAKILINRLDVDKDGKLSKKECPERITKLFNYFDKNNDGFIAEDELTEALKKQAEKNK